MFLPIVCCHIVIGLWNHGEVLTKNQRRHKFLFRSNWMAKICLYVDQTALFPVDGWRWWSWIMRRGAEVIKDSARMYVSHCINVNAHLKWHQSEMFWASDRELVIFLLNLTFYRSLRTHTHPNMFTFVNTRCFALFLLRSIWRFIHGKFNQWNNMDKNTYSNHATQRHTHRHTSTSADRVAAWAYYYTLYSAGKIQTIY